VKIRNAVGIDLGTTYSVAAWIDSTGKSEIIRSRDGDFLTPSAVLFEDRAVLVGKEAKRHGVLNPDRLAECVKRDMGSPYYSRPIAGEFLPPEVIQACILRQLREDISAQVGADFGVVITVPAFFDEPRRRATAIAGEIAGLHVLDIVNEPMAAALAFSEHIGALRDLRREAKPKNVLVYDLGGGTFDVTLLEINRSGFFTLHTRGDVRLGGRDWDMCLADLACERFIEQFREDPRQNPISMQRLLAEVERAKQTLSVRLRARLHVDHAGYSLETEVTRAAFEQRTAPLLERTAHTTRSVLEAAGGSWQHVHHVFLAGGATRMNMVPQMLQRLTSITPETMVSPDESVARGAAVYAKYLLDSASDTPPKFRITNVNAHHLGIQGVERDTGQKVNAVLIPRDTTLPAKITRRFVTRHADQRRIAILVLEGESSIPSECTVIGRAMIRDLPPNLSAGHPVEVTYEYSSNGRLNVHAKVPEVQKFIEINLDRGARLPDAWIGEWKAVVNTKDTWRAYVNLLDAQRARQNDLRDTERTKSFDDSVQNEASGGSIQVAFDEVVLPEGKDDGEVQVYKSDAEFELNSTTQIVLPSPTSRSETEDEYGTMSSVYGRAPARKGKAKRSALKEVVSVVMGGLAAIPIAQVVIWWGMQRDPFEVGPPVGRYVPWVVPQEFRDQ